MASVAGLAPAKVGLKTRLLEPLCIYGRCEKIQVPTSKPQRNSNTQAPSTADTKLRLDPQAADFSGTWMLVLEVFPRFYGAWSFAIVRECKAARAAGFSTRP